MPDKRAEKEGEEGGARPVTVLPVTGRAVGLGQRVGALFAGPNIVAPSVLKSGGLRRVVEEAWKVSDALVFICASGIAVRMIAPLLRSKAVDPAVLVIDETGNFVISLVSGHLGGANDMTRMVAGAIGAVPVITTATDSRGLPCVEEIAQEFSLAIDNFKRIKVVNSAILEGGPVVVVDTDTERRAAIERFLAAYGKEAASLFSFAGSVEPKEAVRAYLVITPSAEVELFAPLKGRTMLLRPRRYVAGIGCRRGVSAQEVRRAVRLAFKSAGLSSDSLKRVATIDIKRDEEGLLEFARTEGAAIEFFTAKELNRVEAVSASSPVVLKATGAKSVAEPAALISAKAERLCQEKVKTKRVTVAIAMIEAPSL